ncbi:MAG: cdisaccharide synthetase [Synergistota bacterium]|nr:cdisaccharide synthetase [Synergistota bacterium]
MTRPGARRVVLLANGPGELWGWVRPLAAELTGRGWDVSLRILPCQFASGEEASVASSLRLSDVSGPESALSTALALSRRGKGEPPDAVIQLGGDLMWGRMLARSSRAPLFCYTYGAKRGLSRCAAVYTAVPARAESIERHGAAPVLVGDLAAEGLARPSRREGAGGPTVAFFPGSRREIFKYAVPLMERTAASLKELIPSLDARMVLSPFSGDEPNVEGLAPVRGGESGSLDGVDFAVTQPGTNTLELTHLSIPFLVAIPFSSLRHAPLSGLAGLVSRLPVAGLLLKEAALRAKGKRLGFTAWPNRLAGRPVVDEISGDITPEDIALRVAEHLHDEARMARAREELSRISASAPSGAAARMANQIEGALST